ncbi:MAG: hypothetical protein V1893_02285 [Candidatus Omnitrophota bacterium]
MTDSKKEQISIGTYLLQRGYITEARLREAEKESTRRNEPIEKSLVTLGYITEEIFAQTFSDLSRIPYIDVTHYIIDQTLIRLIPGGFAKEHLIIPLFRIKDVLTVGMVEPQNETVLNQLRARTALSIEPVMVSAQSLRESLCRYYG